MDYFQEKGTGAVAQGDVETKLKQDQLPTPLEKLELDKLLSEYNKYNNMGRNEIRKLGPKEQRKRREIIQAGKPTLQSLRNNKQ